MIGKAELLILLLVSGIAIRAAADAAPKVYDRIPLCIVVGDGTDPVAGASRYGMVVWGEKSAARFPSLKAANPNLKLFIYEMVGAVVDGNGRTDPIGNAWISANHPEWYLLDSKGQRIHFDAYPYMVAVDQGIPQHQELWASKAIAACKSGGVAGVFIDNCNDRYDWNYMTPSTKYPTQALYAEAMDKFIRFIAAKFRAAGVLLIGNVSGETWESGRLAQWLQMLDGFAIEPTPYGADGTPQEVDKRWLSLYKSFQSNPEKLYLQYMPPHTQSERNRRYALACFLIWKGPNSFATYCETRNEPQRSFPLSDVHIGKPTGPAVNASSTVYTRDYENGVVYLNMSKTEPATITLPPGLKDYSGASVPSGPRILAPHDSLILLKS